MVDDSEGDVDDNDDDDDWGALVNGAEEDEPAGTAPPSSPPAGVDDARGGTENAPKCPPPGASSRFPWTKRCWRWPSRAEGGGAQSWMRCTTRTCCGRGGG